jgi:transcriptional regulator with XRE-family HTH domain
MVVATMPRRTPNKLGATLRRLRERAGLSQEEVADRAGIERSYISMLENGRRRNLSYDLALRIAGALGVTTAELYGDGEGGSAAGPQLDVLALPVPDGDSELRGALRRLLELPREYIIEVERMGRRLYLRGEPPADRPQGSGEDDAHPDEPQSQA